MRREQYGQEHAEFGWKIEKVSAGGLDAAENLRPHHCSNRYDAANGKAHRRITADRRGAPAVEYARRSPLASASSRRPRGEDARPRGAPA